MADGKQIAIKILKVIGKGIWGFAKLLGRAIKREHRAYRERQRIRESEQAYYRQISREAHADEVGRQQAIYEFRARDRARRERERDQIAYQKRLNQMFAPPQLSENAFTQDFPPKKRKRKRQDYFY